MPDGIRNLLLALCQGSEDAQGTIFFVRERAGFGYMQGKNHNHCTISLALPLSFKYFLDFLAGKKWTFFFMSTPRSRE